MNDISRTLLHYIAENDMPKARSVAKVMLQGSKTAKDQEFCEKLLKKMEDQDSQGVQIPFNLQGIIRQDCTPYGFDPNRYYLTEREAILLKHLIRMYTVGEKMSNMGLHYANAVLLHGVSGTGKTTFAQYAAAALNLPFFYVNITNLINSYMGKTGQNIELVFQFASSMPCVLVLDEIDQIATQRGDDSGVSGEIKRVLISVMQNLDRLPNNVVLIGATNRLHAIDTALLRRFPVKHEVKPLRVTEAASFVSAYLSKTGVKWKGEIDPFLAFTVHSREDPVVEVGTYTPAVMADCLNEQIALALDQDMDDPLVSLQ